MILEKNKSEGYFCKKFKVVACLLEVIEMLKM